MAILLLKKDMIWGKLVYFVNPKCTLFCMSILIFPLIYTVFPFSDGQNTEVSQYIEEDMIDVI